MKNKIRNLDQEIHAAMRFANSPHLKMENIMVRNAEVGIVLNNGEDSHLHNIRFETVKRPIIHRKGKRDRFENVQAL